MVFRIAIVGGGIAGASLFLALKGLDGVEVTVFDGARELREIGASIALQPCSLRLLEQLGMGDQVDEIAYRGPSLASMIYRNHRTGEVIAAPPPTNLPLPHHRTARFFRPHLHQILTVQIPPDQLRLGKKLQRVEDDPSSDRPVKLTFLDGSEFECDLLVGCDGIKSAVRRAYLPEYELSMGRAFTMRGVFPTSKLDGMEDFPEDSAHWWGPDRAFFTSPLARGIFSFVAFVPDSVLQKESEDQSYLNAKWGEKGSSKDLVQMYQDWHPIIRTVCEAADDVRLYPDYHGPPLDRMDLSSGRACLVGDAAHPHGGAFAVGGSLAIEDAYALSLCIRRSLSSPATFPFAQALSVYSDLRIGHVNKVIAAALSVRKAKDERNDKGLKMAEEEIRKSVLERVETEWIGENDVERAFEALVGGLRACPISQAPVKRPLDH